MLSQACPICISGVLNAPCRSSLQILRFPDKIFISTIFQYHKMKTRNQRTLALIFSRPAPAGVRWLDVTALLLELGAMDKGAVTSLRKWLEENGVCR